MANNTTITALWWPVWPILLYLFPNSLLCSSSCLISAVVRLPLSWIKCLDLWLFAFSSLSGADDFIVVTKGHPI